MSGCFRERELDYPAIFLLCLEQQLNWRSPLNEDWRRNYVIKWKDWRVFYKIAEFHTVSELIFSVGTNTWIRLHDKFHIYNVFYRSFRFPIAIFVSYVSVANAGLALSRCNLWLQLDQSDRIRKIAYQIAY